jgi:hypothetical protein
MQSCSLDDESSVRSEVEPRVNASLPCYGASLQLRARRVLNSHVKLDTRLILDYAKLQWRYEKHSSTSIPSHVARLY